MKRGESAKNTGSSSAIPLKQLSIGRDSTGRNTGPKAVRLKGFSLRIGLALLWRLYYLFAPLFLIVLVVDVAYIWIVAMPSGAMLYVNRFGEGPRELAEIVSPLPWLIVMVKKILWKLIDETKA
ncbi:MAG TPA: hypothetical protein VGS11_10835 [Candidatus Bathyarchaeia archaeon]|nr:hypothetical protein [Candidatus Bathyarchaeia archaeon]